MGKSRDNTSIIRSSDGRQSIREFNPFAYTRVSLSEYFANLAQALDLGRIFCPNRPRKEGLPSLYAEHICIHFLIYIQNYLFKIRSEERSEERVYIGKEERKRVDDADDEKRYGQILLVLVDGARNEVYGFIPGCNSLADVIVDKFEPIPKCQHPTKIVW